MKRSSGDSARRRPGHPAATGRAAAGTPRRARTRSGVVVGRRGLRWGLAFLDDRPDRAGSNPGHEIGDLGVAEPPLRRHLELVLVADRLDQAALLGLARHDDRPGVAAVAIPPPSRAAGHPSVCPDHGIASSGPPAAAGSSSRTASPAPEAGRSPARTLSGIMSKTQTKSLIHIRSSLG